MLHHFRCIPFILGILVGGLLLIYYRAPATIVYEYPHPQNMTHRVYRDNNNVCYSYSAKEVDCDANESTLRQYPLQG